MFLLEGCSYGSICSNHHLHMSRRVHPDILQRLPGNVQAMGFAVRQDGNQVVAKAVQVKSVWLPEEIGFLWITRAIHTPVRFHRHFAVTLGNRVCVIVINNVFFIQFPLSPKPCIRGSIPVVSF